MTGLAWRQVRRGALLVVLLAAGVPALIATTHGRVFADPADVAGLRAIAADPAIRTLFGEPLALADPGGFAVWRSGTVTAVLVGVWAALTTTRTTRGQEEPGRWTALLAGPVSLRGTTARHLGVLALLSVLAGAATAAALVLAGTDPAGAAVHGAGTGLLGLFATAVAAGTSQLFTTRAAASGAAVAVLGAGLLVRMVGDGVGELSWLRWTSPFGWVQLSRPYAGDRAGPLLLLVAVTAVLAAAALVAAGHRDVGEGLLAHRSHRPAQRGLLGSVEAFALRRCLRPVAGWSTGVGAYYLLLGLTAVSVTGFLAGNAGVADMAGRTGFTGLDRVEGFTAAVFTLLAVPVGAFAAARLAAFAAAESDRRLVLLAAAPLTRLRLLGAEVAATTAGALVLTAVAALATWVGVAAAGGGLALTDALRGTFNTLPVTLLCLGVAVLAAGAGLPAVTALGCLPGAGGFLLQVLADSVDAPAGVRGLSPVSHLAPVPLRGVDWTAALVMTALAVLLALAGAAVHRRRDLRC
ncbi:hypothetical protein [Kineococcus indalonis]|uniref:hypothetical protein n=1 Tax=Kineococcus indalonis TaxID=2696566 RepID=UPI00196A5800|nr:hypothetical protein [Kineococcus indalonis]